MKAFADMMVYATFIGAVVFVVVYARRHWLTSGIGINLMLLGVVVAIESGLALSVLVFGVNWPHRELVRGVAWLLIAATLWHRVYLVLRMPNPNRLPRLEDLAVEREQLLARLATVDRALLEREVSPND